MSILATLTKRASRLHATPLIAALLATSAALTAAPHTRPHLRTSICTKADTIIVSAACADTGAPACAQAVLSIATDDGGVPTEWSTQADTDSLIYKMYRVREGDTLRAECFASLTDRAVCLRICAPKGRAIDAAIGLASPSRHRTKGAASQLTMTGHTADTEHSQTRFCYMAKALADSAATISVSGGKMFVSRASQLTIFLVGETATGGTNTPYIEQCADDAWHLVNFTYQELRNRHTGTAAAAAKPARHKRKKACGARKSP